MNDLQDIGASLGFEPESDQSGNLGVRLDGLISGATLLTIDEAAVRQAGDVFFAIAHIHYRRDVGDNNHQTVRETVVLLEVPGTVFPHLSIQPRTFGAWLMEKAAGLAGLEEVDFPGHEVYDKTYSTFTFMGDAVRRLMDDDMLAYLAERPGLKIQTSDDRVLVCRPGKLLAGEELTALVDDAQGLLSRMTASARRMLDEGWNPQDAAVRMSETMGGMLGRMLRGRMVTRQQAEEFIALSPPREIPANIDKSFVSFSKTLRNVLSMLTGTVCVILAVFAFLAINGRMPTAVAIAIIAIQIAVIGGIGTGLYFANRFHRTRLRILKDGEASHASVLSVSDTNVSINNQRRFKVELEYDARGEKRRTSVNAYGQSVQLAQSLLQSGQETEVLVDPENPDNVLWSGMLVNWNDASTVGGREMRSEGHESIESQP